MNETALKIAITEVSVIVRSGLSAALKRISGFHVQTFEITSNSLISNYIHIHKPDILVVNPVFWGTIDVKKIKADSEQKNLKVVAITTSIVDEELLKNYDETITIFDSIEQLSDKIHRLFSDTRQIDSANGETETLSLREKEVLTCVVKGMTNKEIAQTLCLSTHTVITHRRNITRKLEIHSTAGLTVYAIVNKLIELNDIKND